MRYLYIGAGLFLIITGMYSMIKKSTTFHQGVFPFAVDVPKYTKFFGCTDILSGIVYVILGIIYSTGNLELLILVAILILNIVCAIYGSKKYRIKE